MFWIACPEAPLIRLSSAENIIILFFILVSQIDNSQLFVFRTLPEPSGEFNFNILIKSEFL